MKLLPIACTALLLAGCAGAPAPEGFQRIASQTEFLDKVADVPMTFDNGVQLIANRDGTIGGDANGVTPTGTWRWTPDGQLCRTVSIGPQAFPEVCTAIEVDDGLIRLIDGDGAVFAEGALG